MDAETLPTDPADAPYARFGLPKLGLRNYWNPILLSRELGRKPRAVRMLGEDIAIYRDGGNLYAVEDRCPHRGVKLSAGACLYKGTGTITCPYHGWTFDGADGTLKAALMDGPDAPIAGKVRIKSYPVQERAGLIWVFVGDMEPVALDEDLTPFMADQNQFFALSFYADYKANWRALADNWPNDHHAPFAHRNSPELLFQPILPFATTTVTAPLPDDKGITYAGKDGITSAEYPGLGRFPESNWWRFMKPAGRGKVAGYENSKAFKVYGIPYRLQLRLPASVVVGRQSGEYCLIQWATPIDEHTTRCFNINNFRRMGFWRGLYDRVHYYVWRRWAHDVIFSGQDKTIVEALVPGPERLSKSDMGVIAWRKFAGAHARQPPQNEIRRVG